MSESLHLSKLDVIIIIIYMLGLLKAGFYFRRFSTKGIENYFLAGRKLPGWANGASYAATCMNTDVAPAYCGMTVISGLFIYWFYISRFGLAFMVAAVLFAVFWRRLRLFTSPEFYELRFSGRPATLMRGWIAVRSAFVAVVAWTGAGLLGLHKVVEPVFGWSQFATFSIVIPVVLIYVFLSGYAGVVFTDIAQTVIIILSSLVLCVLVLQDFGGPAGLHDQLVATFGQSVVNWYPPAGHEMLGVVGLFAWTIGTAVGYGGDVAPMGGAMEGQRVFSCKNPREASKLYIWALIVLFFLLAILTLPALGAMVRWPGLHTGELNKETSYGLLLAHYMPSGLLGIAIAGMAASIMSTIDSNLNFGSQVFMSDIYRRLIRPGMTDRHYLNVGRTVMFVIMGLALLVAWKATNVIDIAIFMLGLSSAELTANWAQWWWWRFNAKARIVASFGGPLIFVVVRYVLFSHAGAYTHVLLSISITTVLWILVSLTTEPEDEETLVEFYRRANPLGFWGPIAAKAQTTQLERSGILLGLGIAGLGMAAVATGIIAFCHVYVGKWLTSGVFAVTCISLSYIFRKLYRSFITKIE
jgi:Na+/proline symporter